MARILSQLNQRYQRQMLLDGFGAEAQQKLGQSTALIVGCGDLQLLQGHLEERVETRIELDVAASLRTAPNVGS